MITTRALRTAVAGASAAALLLLASGGAAFANHTHAKVVGNGECVVLAEGAGEEAVNLPGAVFTNNPNVDAPQVANRMHPLHVLVHLGRAGENNALYVYGTPAADAACADGYVNR